MAGAIREDAVSGTLLAALGAYAAFKGYGYGLGSLSQPGAGFFPFWSAVLLLGCAMAIALRALVRLGSGLQAAYPNLGSWKVWTCVAALVVYAILVPLLGFGISTFLVLVGLMRLDPKTSWRASLAISACSAAAFWLLFAHALGVAFPPSLTGL